MKILSNEINSLSKYILNNRYLYPKRSQRYTNASNIIEIYKDISKSQLNSFQSVLKERTSIVKDQHDRRKKYTHNQIGIPQSLHMDTPLFQSSYNPIPKTEIGSGKSTDYQNLFPPPSNPTTSTFSSPHKENGRKNSLNNNNKNDFSEKNHTHENKYTKNNNNNDNNIVNQHGFFPPPSQNPTLLPPSSQNGQKPPSGPRSGEKGKYLFPNSYQQLQSNNSSSLNPTSLNNATYDLRRRAGGIVTSNNNNTTQQQTSYNPYMFDYQDPYYSSYSQQETLKYAQEQEIQLQNGAQTSRKFANNYSQTAIAQSRLTDARKLERSLRELGELFGKMASLVSSQGEDVTRIDEDIERGYAEVEAAHTEIQYYYNLVSSNRGLMIKLFLVLCIFIVIFVGYY